MAALRSASCRRSSSSSFLSSSLSNEARATNSILHLKDRELVATAGLVDDRGLDAGDPGPARELVEGEVLQMLRIPHDHVHHHVVTAGPQKNSAGLRHPRDLIHEPLDPAALVARQF